MLFRSSRYCEENDTPYYPIRLAKEKTQLRQYIEKAQQERNITFVGRLGTYRYLDMHITIAEALEVVERFLDVAPRSEAMPAFMVDPLG